jgi:hypothetical protein
VQIEAAVRARLSTIAGSGLAIPQLSPQNMVAQPTVELAETTTRTPGGFINFTKFESEINLRYGATGASYCQVHITQGGLYYAFYYDYAPSANKNLNANLLPRGYYVWSVTCFTPQYTWTTVNAYGFVKQSVKELNWLTRTTSTGGNWRTLNVPGNSAIENYLVSWSVNDLFAQKYTSVGGDYCNVESYGFTGSLFLDPERPGYNGSNAVDSRPFVPKLLWCTGPGAKPLRPGSAQTLACTGANYPSSFDFGAFNLGNPSTAAAPLGPYEGYKWRLECKTLDDSKAVVMYGKMQ